MNTTLLLKANNIEELKLLGSYIEVKKHLENELDINLGLTGWVSLFDKIKDLKQLVSSNKSYLSSIICDENSFKESKDIISKKIKIKIKAKNWDELRAKVEKLIILFCDNVFDPYEYYEQTKLNKFKNSSKLEGIDIDVSNEVDSLESVLEKYKR